MRASCAFGPPPLTIDERLFEAEWHRNVDRDMSVSAEMVDRGRMYSTLSEKPTRALDGGRAVESSSSSLVLLLLLSSDPLTRNDGCDMDLLTEWPGTNKLPSEGVPGALPACAGGGGGGGSGGVMIEDKSCEETAPERRCTCPRLPAGGPGRNAAFGGDGSASPLAGLVLTSDMPGRAGPPINSLPPRLWCPCTGLAGVAGDVSGAVVGERAEGAAAAGFRAPAGLKVKSGRALMDLCLMCGMDPRRPVGYAWSDETWSDAGRALGGAASAAAASGARMGNEKAGLGISSMGPALGAWRRW